MAATTRHADDTEFAILARILGDENGEFSDELARYILDLRFNDRDQARMHDLVVRNQHDDLSAAEKEELAAFGKAGDLLAALKSKARRTLGIKQDKKSLPLG